MGPCTEPLHEGGAVRSATQAEAVRPRLSAHTASSLFSLLLLLTGSHCHLAMHVSCNAMRVPVPVDKMRR